MVTEELEEVLGQLDDAFGDEPLPSEDRLVYDNSGYHLECNQVRARFRGRHWRNLRIEDLEGEGDALSFFTPEAFRFFLPAFIRISLLDPVRADLITDAILASFAQADLLQVWEKRKEALLEAIRARDIPDKLLLGLAPTEKPRPDAHSARVEVLTEDQRRAVKSFVSFLRKHRAEEFTFGELDLVEEVL